MQDYSINIRFEKVISVGVKHKLHGMMKPLKKNY